LLAELGLFADGDGDGDEDDDGDGCDDTPKYLVDTVCDRMRLNKEIVVPWWIHTFKIRRKLV
jgi:hypothetical protein